MLLGFEQEGTEAFFGGFMECGGFSNFETLRELFPICLFDGTNKQTNKFTPGFRRVGALTQCVS
jgi:hypothetical protein